MFDIDCHIIIHKEPRWKIDRCLASLEGQPVNLHFVAGEDEPRGPVKGRMKGFSLGKAPYVCYADPDDWVEPGSFSLLNAAIGSSDFVYGWENVVRGDRVVVVNTMPHHLFVFSRDLVQYARVEGMLLDYATAPACVGRVLYNWDIGGRYG